MQNKCIKNNFRDYPEWAKANIRNSVMKILGISKRGYYFLAAKPIELVTVKQAQAFAKAANVEVEAILAGEPLLFRASPIAPVTPPTA